MNAAASALASIQGHEEAEELLRELRAGIAAPQALHEALQRLGAAGDAARLRAFCRSIQRALEGR